MSTDPRPATEAGGASQDSDALERATDERSIAGAPVAAVERAAAPAVDAPAPRSSRRRNILLLIGAIIAIDVLAFLFVPPFPIGEPGQQISGIGDLIMANLEFPAPHVVWDPNAVPGPGPGGATTSG